MKNIAFDSCALISLFREEKGHEMVSNLLVEMASNKIKGWMSVINAGEIYYIISRKSDSNKAKFAIPALLQFPITLVEVDLKNTLEAADLKARYKLSYADAFAAALTISKKATLLSGDNEFSNLINGKNFSVQFL